MGHCKSSGVVRVHDATRLTSHVHGLRTRTAPFGTRTVVWIDYGERGLLLLTSPSGQQTKEGARCSRTQPNEGPALQLGSARRSWWSFVKQTVSTSCTSTSSGTKESRATDSDLGSLLTRDEKQRYARTIVDKTKCCLGAERLTNLVKAFGIVPADRVRSISFCTPRWSRCSACSSRRRLRAIPSLPTQERWAEGPFEDRYASRGSGLA